MTRQDGLMSDGDPRQTRAAAYLRRSTADDLNPGIDSRARQEAAVRSMCGDDVVQYVDWGVSGSAQKIGKRPEFARLKADIAAGRVTSVCAESLSRLGRSTRDLLEFMKLCEDHHVQVQTAKERIDTTGAMGRFLFTVMAAIGELELDMGKERSDGARAARVARHEAAGVHMPGSTPIYGRRHLTADGITRVVDDPERPIEPVLQAFEDAGRSIRATCGLLQDRGVPAPRGGKVWGVSTLRRILEAYERDGLVDLPPVMTAKAGRRPVRSTKAIFAGLLRCHCGRTMTPNLSRKDARTGKPLPAQYYCAGGRDSAIVIRNADGKIVSRSNPHGRWHVNESALRPTLQAEAARYQARAKIWHKAEAGVREAQDRLDRAKERWLVAFTAGTVTEGRWRAETAKIDAAIADLARQAKGTLLLARETIPSWDDIPAMNRHLRTLWGSVTLDADMSPHVEWAVPDTLYGEEDERAAYDQARDEALGEGMSQADFEAEWDKRQTAKSAGLGRQS